ncbi:MAG: trehalose-6-phosphate synthase [Bacteroidetes bacterium]|nr:trehalose-6-phosphate synthase [Bacteroidota bacterium]
MGKLITISSRLPYRVAVSGSGIQATPSVGGLATALRSYFERSSNEFDSLHWIGIADLSKKQFEKTDSNPVIEVDQLMMHQVFLDPSVKQGFNDGFCNSILWPLFLYFPSFVDYKSKHYEYYEIANKILCQKVLEVYESGDTIWIHDYHWMLLPSLLRAELPEANIGFFLHIPFPSFELFRLLPRIWRDGIISGLLGADVIGFQTQDFARHFVDSVRQLDPYTQWDGKHLQKDGQSPMVGAFPISIDYQKFNSAAKSNEVRTMVTKLRQRIGDLRLILSVDRLDYTKAILNRLEGFELFLKQNHGFHHKVSYFLLLVPSRESITKYKENKLNIEALISRINGAYGTLSWTPIVYQYQVAEFRRLVSLYSSADIALIVPSRDGMNLVSKEYVASRTAGTGALILSETAGAAQELQQAIMVNPNDRQQIANAILEGLTMTAEQQSHRISAMQRLIKKKDVQAWASGFLNSMSEVMQSKEHIYGR